jgi:hypothetical protein
LAHCIHKYHYNFGPEDHSNVYVSDLKLILNAARGKGSEIKKNHHLQRRRGKKVVPDYDVFKQYKRVGYMGKRMGKIESGTSIKRGCQRHFYAKQVYMDNSLCQLIYKEITHANKNGDRCHGVNIAGFRHALGTTLSAQKKDEPLPWSTCSCSARIILGLRSIVVPMRAPTDINCKINIHMIPTIHYKYDRKEND